MSRLLSIEEICERALRKIGAYAIRSSGARPEEVAEARYWLDMVMGHEASRQRTWWLVPASATFSLTPNVPSYDLNTVLGTAQAPDGVQFVIECYLYNTSTGTDIHELPILRRQEWERRQLRGPIQETSLDDAEADNPFMWGSDVAVPALQPGTPLACYIDRQQKPTFQVAPTPDSAQPYGVRVLFQSFASDFTKNPPNDRTYKLRTAWNLWAVTALAAQIGNGPVRKMPADEVRDMKQEAQKLRDELERYEGDEQANEPRRVAYSDF